MKAKPIKFSNKLPTESGCYFLILAELFHISQGAAQFVEVDVEKKTVGSETSEWELKDDDRYLWSERLVFEVE